MNPWLRELVRTLAAVAVEDVLAREGGQDVAAPQSEPLKTLSGRDRTSGLVERFPAETAPDLSAVRQRR